MRTALGGDSVQAFPKGRISRILLSSQVVDRCRYALRQKEGHSFSDLVCGDESLSALQRLIYFWGLHSHLLPDADLLMRWILICADYSGDYYFLVPEHVSKVSRNRTCVGVYISGDQYLKAASSPCLRRFPPQACLTIVSLALHTAK